MNIIDEIKSYRAKGYNITIECIPSFLGFVIDDKEDRPYYVHLYLGDSNNSHKPDTLLGIGRGWDIDEAFFNAVANLHHPTTKIKVNQET